MLFANRDTKQGLKGLYVSSHPSRFTDHNSFDRSSYSLHEIVYGNALRFVIDNKI